MTPRLVTTRECNCRAVPFAGGKGVLVAYPVVSLEAVRHWARLHDEARRGERPPYYAVHVAGEHVLNLVPA
jgi:hypothetical protein